MGQSDSLDSYVERVEEIGEGIKRREIICLEKGQSESIKNLLSLSGKLWAYPKAQALKKGLGDSNLTPFFLVPRAGLEPARWGTTEGF